MEASGSFPLPDDPALAAMAVALRDAPMRSVSSQGMHVGVLVLYS